MKKKLMYLILAGLLAGCLFESDKSSGIVDTGDTGIEARIFNPDGTPAVQAKVAVFESGDTSRIPTKQVSTDSAGRYSLKGLAKGRYNVLSDKDNLVAFQDSILVTTDTIFVENDTLGTPVSVTGIVGLQPHHDPRTVVAQILGTDKYSNVNENGYFRFSNLAPGTYNLKLSTTLTGYTHSFYQLSINQATPDTLKDTLWLIFTDIPVVEGLTASYDTLTGVAALKWNPTGYRNFEEFVIYKDDFNSILSQYTPYGVTTDPLFMDSLFQDTDIVFGLPPIRHHYKYRVAIRSNSAQIGPTFKFTSIEGPIRDSLFIPLSPDTLVQYNDSIPVLFSWRPIAGVMRYELTLKKDSLTPIRQFTMNPEIRFDSLKDGFYSWSFRAQKADSGWSAWSKLRSFNFFDSIGPRLNPPKVISPRNGDTVSTLVQILLDTSVTRLFSLQISSDSLNFFNDSSFTYYQSGRYFYLKPNRHYWRIASYNQNGHLGPWSKVYSLIVRDTNQIQLLSPRDSSFIQESDSITFRWAGRLDSGNTYQLEYWPDSSIHLADTVSLREKEYKVYLPSGNYFWQVKSGILSNRFFFTVIKDTI